MSIETLPQITGLEIRHEAIDPSLAIQAQSECAQLHSSPPGNNVRVQDQGETTSDIVTYYVYRSEDIPAKGFPGIHGILENLGRTNGYNVTFNYQAPHAKGGFHVDEKVSESTIIVQLSDDGQFQYAEGQELTESECKAQAAPPLDVGAGDVLVLHDGGLAHRGLNPSNHARYNMVVWKPAPPLTMEEALQESANDIWE